MLQQKQTPKSKDVNKNNPVELRFPLLALLVNHHHKHSHNHQLLAATVAPKAQRPRLAPQQILNITLPSRLIPRVTPNLKVLLAQQEGRSVQQVKLNRRNPRTTQEFLHLDKEQPPNHQASHGRSHQQPDPVVLSARHSRVRRSLPHNANPALYLNHNNNARMQDGQDLLMHAQKHLPKHHVAQGQAPVTQGFHMLLSAGNCSPLDGKV
jgi:hypothetical protein